ncbi:hypothetical protein MMC10_011277 [Thelotrema lepadinum]|nr:hypothetical protein [Thelotrema lepadinum]
MDEGSYILYIRLYILDAFKDKSANVGNTKEYGDHSRIKKLYARVDLAALLEQELQQVKGKILLSVAADEEIRDEIHEIVAKKASKQIQLVFSSYQPKRKASFWHKDNTKHLAKGVV